MFRRIGAALLALGLLAPAAALAQAQIPIVAAENFYGELAARIGGDRVSVTSILSSPDQDPHLFEAAPSTARHLLAARLVIYNGAGYDPWMDSLLAAAPQSDRRAIIVGTLEHGGVSDNPHLWYDPATMPAVARRLVAELTAIDPEHGGDYRARLDAFDAALRPLAAKIAELRAKYAGTVVTATEPIFGDMAAALGFAMRDRRFQLAVMNDTEPGAGDIARFQGEIENREVELLFYNVQTTGPLTRHLLDLARTAHVPVVGVSETEPAGKTYERWMMDQLDAVAAALAAEHP